MYCGRGVLSRWVSLNEDDMYNRPLESEPALDGGTHIEACF